MLSFDYFRHINSCPSDKNVISTCYSEGKYSYLAFSKALYFILSAFLHSDLELYNFSSKLIQNLIDLAIDCNSKGIHGFVSEIPQNIFS